MHFRKQLLLLLTIIFSTLFSKAEQHSGAKIASTADSISTTSRINYLSPNQRSITDSIINYGRLYLNKPYRYGTSGADTFDCSGYTSFVYRNFGYSLGHSSAEQAQQFDAIERSQLKKGDLVYFSGSRKSKRVGHVGIVTTTKDDGRFDFIHASCDRGVTISSSEEDYYKKRYIKANRVIGGTQLLAVAPSVDGNTETYDQTAENGPVTFPAKKVKKTIPARYHKVKSGETLSEIANKYGISVAELKRKNGIKGSKLSLKQRLKVKDSETYSVVEPINVAANKSTEVAKNPATENKELATSEATATPVSHKVKKGETLFSIAKLYNIPVAELEKINNLPNGKIHLGQKLKIAEKTAKVSTTEIATSQPLSQPKTSTHKVISGETLFSIAKMYNVPVEELKRENNFDGNNVHAGQTLKISLPAENSSTNVVAVKEEPKVIAKVEPQVAKPIEKKEVKPELKSETKPEVASKAVSATKHESTKAETNLKVIKHKVHSGESLQTIARDFKISAEELKKINNLGESKLIVGQEIFICLNTDPTSLYKLENPAQETTSKPVLNEVPGIQEKLKPVLVAPVVLKEPIFVKEQTVKESTPKPVTLTQIPTSYKVRRGDHLNSIAKELNVSVEDLKNANNLTSTKLTVGQVLKVNKSAETASVKETVKPEPIAKPTSYKVRKGDNLNTIAKELNVSVEDLKNANNLTSTKLTVGQVLKVNKSTETASVKETVKAEPAAKPTSYKVRKGDNLNTIAKELNVSVEDLKNANNLTDTKLKAGQVLKVNKSTETASVKEAPAKAEPVAKPTTYKVKKGENLSSIAKDFNVTVDELKELNKLSDTKLHLGQELIVGSTEKAKNKKSKQEPEQQTKQKSIHHKLKSGESYYSVAEKYGCTMKELKEWNKDLGSKLKIGDVLTIRK